MEEMKARIPVSRTARPLRYNRNLQKARKTGRKAQNQRRLPGKGSSKTDNCLPHRTPPSQDPDNPAHRSQASPLLLRWMRK